MQLADMFNMIVKFGSYIVDGLHEYRQPILIYIPPYGFVICCTKTQDCHCQCLIVIHYIILQNQIAALLKIKCNVCYLLK